MLRQTNPMHEQMLTGLVNKKQQKTHLKYGVFFPFLKKKNIVLNMKHRSSLTARLWGILPAGANANLLSNLLS